MRGLHLLLGVGRRLVDRTACRLQVLAHSGNRVAAGHRDDGGNGDEQFLHRLQDKKLVGGRIE